MFLNDGWAFARTCMATYWTILVSAVALGPRHRSQPRLDHLHQPAIEYVQCNRSEWVPPNVLHGHGTTARWLCSIMTVTWQHLEQPAHLALTEPNKPLSSEPRLLESLCRSDIFTNALQLDIHMQIASVQPSGLHSSSLHASWLG